MTAERRCPNRPVYINPVVNHLLDLSQICGSLDAYMICLRWPISKYFRIPLQGFVRLITFIRTCYCYWRALVDVAVHRVVMSSASLARLLVARPHLRPYTLAPLLTAHRPGIGPNTAADVTTPRLKGVYKNAPPHTFCSANEYVSHSSSYNVPLDTWIRTLNASDVS